MRSGKSSYYIPFWKNGARVRLSQKPGRCAIVVAALANPSNRREHQWYDVQFDDGLYGRFQEKYLEGIPMASETRVA